MAVALQAAGHGVTVLTGGEGPFVDSLRARSVPTIILRHLRGPIAPIRDVLALREIRAVLADVRPDLLAAHSSKAGILGRLAGRSLRMPVVFTVHGWAFTPGVPVSQAALYRRIERLAAPLASKIITVSEFDRRLALEAHIAPSDRVVTVHNGMPDIPTRLQADPARMPPRLVMVARFQAQKDHASLLRALGGMRDRSWELDLIGNGPLAEDMQSLAASLGLDGRVHFLGRRTDVDQLLSRAQISVLATNWEGFPLSILEAMRAGLPVVASAVGGVSESVRDEETGYLVPRGDVDRLRDRIGRLLDAPALRARLGSQGRARFEQHFTLQASVDKTIAVYREVLAST